MADEKKHQEDQCPLHAVHRRLEDLHKQWHHAAEQYFDPDGFRIAIQTAIQTSRTVTFILQSNKRIIPDFETWYQKWQDEFKSNKLMRWMVDARNRIEKQGDLESHSFVRAEIVASHLNEGPAIEVPAELFDAPWKLVKSIPHSDLGEHIRKDGILRIQRKWIENSLPDYELLEAVAATYGHLSRMLDDAHSQLGLIASNAINTETGEEFDSRTMDGRLPCMIGHSDNRTLNVWLADGRPINVSQKKMPFDAKLAEKAAERYNLDPSKIIGIHSDSEKTLDNIFKTAMVLFEKDGSHATVMFLLKGGMLIDVIQVALQEHGEKYLMMRSLATRAKIKGADGIIFVSEAWTAAYDQNKPYRRAVDSPEKGEVLLATLVTKNSDAKQWIANIERNEKAVTLKNPLQHDGGAQFMFAPFYEAWGKPIPDEWAEQMKKMASQDPSGQ